MNRPRHELKQQGSRGVATKYWFCSGSHVGRSRSWKNKSFLRTEADPASPIEILGPRRPLRGRPRASASLLELNVSACSHFARHPCRSWWRSLWRLRRSSGSQKIQIDNSLSQLFRSNTPEFKQFEQVSRSFRRDEYDVLVVVEGKSLLPREFDRKAAQAGHRSAARRRRARHHFAVFRTPARRRRRHSGAAVSRASCRKAPITRS